MSDGYPPDWGQRRKKVYARDRYECRNCGRCGGPRGNAELHAHHIVPKAEGGSHEISNLATLCKECHNKIHSGQLDFDNSDIKHTGMPHTWPGPEWNSSKGLSQGKSARSDSDSNSTSKTSAHIETATIDTGQSVDNNSASVQSDIKMPSSENSAICINEHLEPVPNEQFWPRRSLSDISSSKNYSDSNWGNSEISSSQYQKGVNTNLQNNNTDRSLIYFGIAVVIVILILVYIMS